VTGARGDMLIRKHPGGVSAFIMPAWKDDVALELRRVATP
jgi:hypothetical protein